MINNVVKLFWQHFILCKRQVPFAEKYSIPFPLLPFFSLYNLGKSQCFVLMAVIVCSGKTENKGWEMERSTQRSFTTFKGLGKAPCSAGSSCRALWQCQSWDTAIVRLKQGKNGNFNEGSSKLMGQRASAQPQAVLSIHLPALGWILTCMNTSFTSKQVCSKALLYKVTS